MAWEPAPGQTQEGSQEVCKERKEKGERRLFGGGFGDAVRGARPVSPLGAWELCGRTLYIALYIGIQYTISFPIVGLGLSFVRGILYGIV